MKVKIIIGLILLSIFSLGIGVSYMQYHTNHISLINQKIASFIFNVEKTDKLEIPLDNLKPGDKLTYDFSVTNTQDDLTSNVTIEYQIILKTYHLVPLNIELYNIEKEKENLVLNCNENFNRNNENQLLCNAPIKELMYTGNNKDNYRLKITFPEEFNDESYSNLIDFLDIEIISNQKI